MFLLLVFLVKFVCAQTIEVGVENEFDLAKTVLMNEPSTEILFVPFQMDDGYKLYDPYKAVREHKQLQRKLEDLGLKVIKVRDVLLRGTQDKNGNDYKDLLDFASNFLKYDDSHLEKEKEKLMNLENITPAQRSNLMKEIKKLEPKITKSAQESARLRALSKMPPESLVDIIMNRPTVVLHLKHWFMDDDLAFVIVRSQTLQNPLDTLHYTRDQQITTKKGVVMMTMPPDREGESAVTEFVFRKLGVNIIGKQTTGYAEGGDFFPVGDMAFFGQGLRTTYSAIEQMLSNDWFGFDEIVVPKERVDFPIERVHLDSVFNILDHKGNVVALEHAVNRPEQYVYADVYSKKGLEGKNGKRFGPYMKVATDVRFGELLRNRYFKITLLSNKEERDFGANFLNVGRGTIVTPYCEADYVRRLKDVGIKLHCVDVEELMNNGGAVHCMTQVIKRVSSNSNSKR